MFSPFLTTRSFCLGVIVSTSVNHRLLTFVNSNYFGIQSFWNYFIFQSFWNPIILEYFQIPIIFIWYHFLFQSCCYHIILVVKDLNSLSLVLSKIQFFHEFNCKLVRFLKLMCDSRCSFSRYRKKKG